MIDTQNRLRKLVKKSLILEAFIKAASYQSHWYLGPYVGAGHQVNKLWIEAFWITHKGGLNNVGIHSIRT